MSDLDDEKIRELMHQMMDVPFTDELKQRILEKANSTRQKPEKKKRLLFGTFRFGAASAGLIAAIALVLVALNQPGKVQPKLYSSSASNQQVDLSAAYGMMKAPIQIQDLRIGEEPGYPKKSEVIATLTNETSSTIQASDVFGILAFSKTGYLQNLADADWISFVNGPDKDHPILPHQSINWVFRPVSAPHSSTLALTETPHLMFYQSQLVEPEKADITWIQSPLKVNHVAVVLNSKIQSRYADGQSITLEADIKNPLSQPVDFSHQLCFIWFDQNGANQFTTFSNPRFISHLSAGVENKKLLLPGESVHASFRLIGPTESKYFTNTAHLVIVQTP